MLTAKSNPYQPPIIPVEMKAGKVPELVSVADQARKYAKAMSCALAAIVLAPCVIMVLLALSSVFYDGHGMALASAIVVALLLGPSAALCGWCAGYMFAYFRSWVRG